MQLPRLPEVQRISLPAGVPAGVAPPAPPEVAAMAPDEVDGAMRRAQAAFPGWRDTAVADRARALRRAADLLEKRRPHLMATLAREAGKTIDDGVAEIREAVDFLRYYADEAEALCVTRQLPGPAGEENVYAVRGRGVWLAIAPWNFPLAIFLGQVAAALAIPYI